MSKQHHYKTQLEWTGNNGEGTSDYRSYKRDHIIQVEGKSHAIQGSSDPSFRGNPTRYNPEELLVASLSSCHMLWYLHLCSANGIVVDSYSDHAKGIMEEQKNGAGAFKEVVLQPIVSIRDSSKEELAESLHQKAHEMCFIANSCNFPIRHQPSIRIN